MLFRLLRKFGMFRPSISKLLEKNNIPSLIEALFDPEPEIQEQAEYSFVHQIPHADSVPILLTTFDKYIAKAGLRNLKQISTLASILKKLAAPSSLEPLIIRLAHKQSRPFVQIALSGFGASALPAFIRQGERVDVEAQKVLASLIFTMLKSNPQVISIWYDILKSYEIVQEPDQPSKVIPLLNHRNSWVRIQALFILVITQKKEALPEILRLTKDSDELIKLFAIKHIGEFQDEEVLPILLSFLSSAGEEIQEAAITSMITIQSPKSIQMLYQFLFTITEEDDVWDLVIEAIARHQSKEAIQITIDLLLQKEPGLSYGPSTLVSLIDGLEETKDPIALPALQEAVHRYASTNDSFSYFDPKTLRYKQKTVSAYAQKAISGF